MNAPPLQLQLQQPQEQPGVRDAAADAAVGGAAIGGAAGAAAGAAAAVVETGVDILRRYAEESVVNLLRIVRNVLDRMTVRYVCSYTCD